MSTEHPEEHHDDEVDSGDRIELVSDGENILVVGSDRGVVERALDAYGLVKHASVVSLERLSPMIQVGASIAQEATKAAGEFGMWLKVTPESAKAIQDAGLIDTGVKGVKYAMVGVQGKVQSWVSVETGVGAALTNPAVLAGAAGVLAQAARQQETAQLKALLESVDGKLDEALRNQRDELLGDLEGIEDELREAFTIRDREGRADEIAWSKVQGESSAIKKTLRKALRRLDGLAEDLESQKKLKDISVSIPAVQGEAESWLSVVARCLQLQDQMAVLELDRILEIDPDNVNNRRLSLAEFRDTHRAQVLETASELVARMDAAATRADRQGLLHKDKAPAAVQAIDGTKKSIAELVKSIGVELALDAIRSTDWKEALKSKEHLKAAGKEAGITALKGLGAAAVTVVAGVVSKDKVGDLLGGKGSSA